MSFPIQSLFDNLELEASDAKGQVRAERAAHAPGEESLTGQVLLLVTNDTHSQMLPTSEDVGGAARRASYFKGRAHEVPLILDVGDSFQGSPYFSFFGGEVEMSALERMGYRAMAIGNHDFDSGLEELRRHAREQCPNVKLLCANLQDSTSGELAFEPHALYEAKIETLTVTHPSHQLTNIVNGGGQGQMEGGRSGSNGGGGMECRGPRTPRRPGTSRPLPSS